jgi:hypothetical protein
LSMNFSSVEGYGVNKESTPLLGLILRSCLQVVNLFVSDLVNFLLDSRFK